MTSSKIRITGRGANHAREAISMFQSEEEKAEINDLLTWLQKR